MYGSSNVLFKILLKGLVFNSQLVLNCRFATATFTLLLHLRNVLQCLHASTGPTWKTSRWRQDKTWSWTWRSVESLLQARRGSWTRLAWRAQITWPLTLRTTRQSCPSSWSHASRPEPTPSKQRTLPAETKLPWKSPS